MQKAVFHLFLLFVMVLTFSCGSKKSTFEIISFNAITNHELQKNDSIIETDLSNAPIEGIRIPSTKQIKGGRFSFDFTITKKSSTPEKLYYRLYYQNCSYKFDESHEYNGENFYGSWESDTIGFKPIPDFKDKTTIIDSLTIIGNPRNEQLYFGPNPKTQIDNPEDLINTINFIKDNKDWYSAIIQKAKSENRNIDEQLILDAKWALSEKKKNDTF